MMSILNTNDALTNATKDESIYSLISKLCIVLLRESKEPVDGAAVSKCQSLAFEVLLKRTLNAPDRSKSYTEDVNKTKDEIRHRLIIAQLQSCLNGSTDSDSYKHYIECEKLIEENQKLLFTTVGGAMVNMMLNLTESSIIQPNDASNLMKCDINKQRLLSPDAYTLHCPKRINSNYPDIHKMHYVLNPSPKYFKGINTNMAKTLQNKESSIESQIKFGRIEMFKPLMKNKFDQDFAPKKQARFSGFLYTTKSNTNVKRVLDNLVKCRNQLNHENRRLASETATKTADHKTRKRLQKCRSSRSWESLGSRNGTPVEKQFLSDTNICIELQQILTVSQGDEFIPPLIVAVADFIQQLKLVSVGIKSDIFSIDDCGVYSLRPNISVGNILPQQIQEFVEPFVECGTCYRNMRILLRPKTYQDRNDGFIFRSMYRAVDEYLSTFREFVFGQPQTTMLSRMYLNMQMPMQQLVEFCMTINSQITNIDNKPKGCYFLGYIWREIQRSSKRRHITLLLYLLKRMCSVYYKHLEQWIYEGVLDDPMHELFISYVDNYSVQSKYFFDKAFFVQPDLVPGFLQACEEPILACGKYTMLLKAFNSHHPIFALTCPDIMLCLNEDDLQKLRSRCVAYAEQAKAFCQPISIEDIYKRRQAERKRFKERVNQSIEAHLRAWKESQRILARKISEKRNKKNFELNVQRKLILQNKIDLQYENLARELQLQHDIEKFEKLKLQRKTVQLQQRINYLRSCSEDVHSNIIDATNNITGDTISKSTSNIHLTGGGDNPSPLLDYEIVPNSECVSISDETSLITFATANPSIADIILMSQDEIDDDDKTDSEFVDRVEEVEELLDKLIPAPLNAESNRIIRRSKSDVLNLNVTTDAVTVHCDLKQNLAKPKSLTKQVVNPQTPEPGAAERKSTIKRSESDVLNSNSPSDATALNDMQRNRARTIGTTEQFVQLQHVDQQSPELATADSMATMKYNESDKLNSNVSSHADTLSDMQRNRDRTMGSTFFHNPNTKTNQTEASHYKSRVMFEEYGITPTIGTASPPMMPKPTALQLNKLNCMGTHYTKPPDINLNTLSKVSERRKDMEINRDNMMRGILEFCEYPKWNSAHNLLPVAVKEESSETQKPNSGAKPVIAKDHIESTNAPVTPMSTTSDMSASMLHEVQGPNANSAAQLDASNNNNTVQEVHKVDAANDDTVSNDGLSDGALSNNTVDDVSNDDTDYNVSHPSFKVDSVKNNIGMDLADAYLQRNSAIGLISECSMQFQRKYAVANDKAPYARLLKLAASKFRVTKAHNSCWSLLAPDESIALLDINAMALGTQLNHHSTIMIQQFLQRSIMLPLETHFSLVRNEVMRIFYEELNIYDHFRSLRNYFFMFDGEFGSLITEGIITPLQNGMPPQKLLSFQTLHGVLDRALASSTAGFTPNSQNLSFIVTDVPDSFHLSSPDVLNVLSLSYRVKWPLNLILNAESLERYTQIFQYLFKLRRVSYVLDSTYQYLRLVPKQFKGHASSQYIRLQLIRHKLAHFVGTFKNYLDANALRASWLQFKRDLLKVNTIEALYRTHAMYLKQIMFLCLNNRNSAKLNTAIDSILTIALRFHILLTARPFALNVVTGEFVHPRYERLVNEESEFHKFLNYTLYLGRKAVQHNYQQEISEFVRLLDFNDFYSLSQ